MKPLKTKTSLVIALFTSLCGLTTSAQQTAPVTPALVDFDAYEHLVSEVKEHRKTRLLNVEEFKTTSKQEHVIILDTRSDSMYTAVHIKGAIHLNFSDFTQENLAKIIPSKDYKILIYCNNNFNTKPLVPVSVMIPDLSRYFVTKASFPGRDFNPALFTQKINGSKKKKKSSQKQIQSKQTTSTAKRLTEPASATKSITLALNIPTYINLYGYGYKHVYELSELVNTFDNTIEFEGTAIDSVLKNH